MAIAVERFGEGGTFSRRTGRVTVLFDDHKTLVTLSGEVDLILQRELNGHAEDVISRRAPVLVDLSELSFIDSIGLGFLARIARAGRASGFPLAVIGATSRIRGSLALAGLEELVDYPD